ncbi:MAG: DedA family protein [Flavitalea sp.]
MGLLFIDTQSIIAWGGVFIIAALIFAETGLLLGLALPGGETLVFTSGVLVSTGTLNISIYFLVPLLLAVAILGDLSGFMIGRKFSERLYQKEDTWYYRKKYFEIAKDYLNRHSRMAVVMGKFLPIIRPFTPVVSGMTGVPFGRFISLSILASVLYISIFSLSGYFLGKQFPFIKDYIFWLLPVSIIVAVVIMYTQAKKYKREQGQV